MAKTEQFYAGVDVGASRTKTVLLNKSLNLVEYDVRVSGTDFAETANASLEATLDLTGIGREQIVGVISTGYGRNNVTFATGTRTEIGCHAAGCYHQYPQAITIIDIGGQDNKVIKLDSNGQRTGFKMNRKCAAGTGVFLEEMALRLNLPIDQMNEQALLSKEMVRLGSYCTVFSGTEVLENIRHGKQVPDIVKGIFFSMINRVLEMDTLTECLVMTGGVAAHNPYLVTMAAEILGREVLTTDYPQLTGAVGAALYAARK